MKNKFRHTFEDKLVMSVDIFDDNFVINLTDDSCFVELSLDDIYTMLAVQEEEQNDSEILHIINEVNNA